MQCAICENLEGSWLWETNSCDVFWDLELAHRIYEIFVPYLDGGNRVDFRLLNRPRKSPKINSTQLSCAFLKRTSREFCRVPEWTTLNDPPASSDVSWKLRHKVHIRIGKKKKISSQSHVCLIGLCLVMNSGSLNAQHLPSLNSPSDNPTHRPGVLVSGSSSSQCLKATLPSPKRERRTNYEERSLSGD